MTLLSCREVMRGSWRGRGARRGGSLGWAAISYEGGGSAGATVYLVLDMLGGESQLRVEDVKWTLSLGLPSSIDNERRVNHWPESLVLVPCC